MIRALTDQDNQKFERVFNPAFYKTAALIRSHAAQIRGRIAGKE